jgi:hypothetical protein
MNKYYYDMIFEFSFTKLPFSFIPDLHRKGYQNDGEHTSKPCYRCQESTELSSRVAVIRVGVNNGKKERTDQDCTLHWSAD